MAFKSTTDGKRTSNTNWNKWLSNKARKRNVKQVYPENTNDYVIQEIPMPPIPRSPTGATETSDSTDFDELKRQRMEKMKIKLVACLRAIRNKREDDDGKFAEELIGSKLD